MFDTLVNRIYILAQLQPNKLAVAFKKEQLTYQQLLKRMEGIAGILRELGICPGDKVAFSAPSKPEMIAIYLGVQRCGGVAVFLDKNAAPSSMSMIYMESKSKLMLTDKPLKEYAAGCRIMSLKKVYSDAEAWIDAQSENLPIYQLPEESALAEILFTTGTTGRPKGVMLSYKSVYHILSNTITGCNVQADDILLLPLPLNHSFGLRVLRSVLYKGATLILQNGFTFAKEVENNVYAYQCNAMACVPTSYEVMRFQMQDAFGRVLGNMRHIEFGAGSLSIRQRKEITTLLPDTVIYNTWGSSETGGVIFGNITELVQNEAYIGALGKVPQGAIEVKTVDSEGNEIVSDAAHPGRMALKGDMKMLGYWENEEATSQTLIDGWLLTGDLVYLQHGYIFMLGRVDDIINVGGEKVSPIEVENVAGQYEYIKECACIGAADPEDVLGQIPVLFIVTKNGYEEEAFIKFLSSKMERYKLPQRFIKLLELPRNRMQKIDRRELRKILGSQDSADVLNPVVETILQRRSIRKFTDQEIPRKVLDTILKCGYYAPSGHNMQTWRFTVLTRNEDIQRLKEMIRITAEANKVHVYGFENPKVLILISNDRRNADGCQDAACAAENMMLAAESFGIGSVWLNPLMTLRDKEPVKSVLDDFDIPQEHAVWASVALGYPMNDGILLQKKTDVIKYV